MSLCSSFSDNNLRRQIILQETYTLSNGVSIPKVGLGTWLIPDDKVTEVVGKMAKDEDMEFLKTVAG